MSRRPYFPFRLPPIKTVLRNAPQGFDHLLSEIREHVQGGCRVRVVSADRGSFDIVMNGSQLMTQAIGGAVVGTFGNVAAAVHAGDKHLDEWDDLNFGCNDPKGVA